MDSEVNVSKEFDNNLLSLWLRENSVSIWPIRSSARDQYLLWHDCDNKNQSASSKDAGHFRGSAYHKLGCLWRFQDYSRTESGTEGKMKRRAICIAFFLTFLVLLSLVQESHEITGILIPRRIPKCRRASNRRKVRSCRRGTIKSLVPVFVFTESEIERQKFLRYVANILQVYFVLLMPDCCKTRIQLTPGFYIVLSNS